MVLRAHDYGEDICKNRKDDSKKLSPGREISLGVSRSSISWRPQFGCVLVLANFVLTLTFVERLVSARYTGL